MRTTIAVNYQQLPSYLDQLLVWIKEQKHRNTRMSLDKVNHQVYMNNTLHPSSQNAIPLRVICHSIVKYLL